MVEATTGSEPSVLDGVRVVEFSQLIAASQCGLTLSDLGADVVKAESPHRPDPAGLDGHDRAHR